MVPDPLGDNAYQASVGTLARLVASGEVPTIEAWDRSEWVVVSSSLHGPEFAPRTGRIPGAIRIEGYRLIWMGGGIPWLPSPEELRAIFPEAGIPRVRNAFGSGESWFREPALPLETGYPRRA